MNLLLYLALSSQVLWEDVTPSVLPATAEWTNRVVLADLDGDSRVDLVFANGGNYSEPGEPEPSRVFLNRLENGRIRFEEATERVFGSWRGLARVIQVRDVDGDGHADVFVGGAHQTRSRLYLGEGGLRFRDVTEGCLPDEVASVGDLEIGDVDSDFDLDVVLVDWGPGDSMTNEGGRVLLWRNELEGGAARFVDVTEGRMPDRRHRFSWDLELADVDNDFDLDVLVSCKRCGGGSLFRNDGTGRFSEDTKALPQYTNNYDFEVMDVNRDGFLDLVTVNDGEIVNRKSSHRREHLFLNDRAGRFIDATPELWPESENPGEDDNMVAFLDADSDGDADFLIGSLSGPERLHLNDGSGRFQVRTGVVGGEETPGTLGLALADLDSDGRLDLVQSQGEHKTATAEKVYLGKGLAQDTSKPVISMISSEGYLVRAGVHDFKTPNRPEDWAEVVVESNGGKTPMTWYGENLFFARLASAPASFRICATDRAGNRTCSPTR
jgi:hypothetical protein